MVNSDLSKIDFQKLKQVLPKYKLHLDAESKKWWEALIENKGVIPPTDAGGCSHYWQR